MGALTGHRVAQGILVLSLLYMGEGLKITRLSVPQFVPNGTVDSVLLDCEYTYSKVTDKTLVVKWFHENGSRPVYQWIPNIDVKGSNEIYRVDETYQVPRSDSFTRSRALNLIRPTTEMSGKYKCDLSSLNASDSKIANMVVYALPTSVTLNYTNVDDMVKIICEVEGVYPVPEMSVFRVNPKEVIPIPIEEYDIDYHLEDGAYKVQLITNISESDIPMTSEGLLFFGCRVELNGTDYEKEVRVPYFPNLFAEKQEGEEDNSAVALSASLCQILPVLLALLFFFFT